MVWNPGETLEWHAIHEFHIMSNPWVWYSIKLWTHFLIWISFNTNNMWKNLWILLFSFIPKVQLRSYFKNLCIGFHYGFQTLKNNESIISFLVFGNPDETLPLVFEIVYPGWSLLIFPPFWSLGSEWVKILVLMFCQLFSILCEESLKHLRLSKFTSR